MKKTFLCFVVALLLMAVATPHAQESSHAPHWTYTGKEGWRHWGDLEPSFAACKLGHQQSPIDIRKTEKADLPSIQFNYQSSPLKIIDNGHTIMISYAPGSSITVGGHQYNLTQFHFHHPSEEKINGKSAVMDIHLVHADAEGKLAVVAVLLNPGSPNSSIQALWDNLPKEKDVTHSSDNVTVNAAQLLPADRGYFTFMGSLTTPPCSENVTWFVLKSPMTISREQLAAFAKLYPLDARPTQPLDGRTVRESK